MVPERIDYLVKCCLDQTASVSEKEELAVWVSQQTSDEILKEVLEKAWSEYESASRMPDAVSERILSTILRSEPLSTLSEPIGNRLTLNSRRAWLQAASIGGLLIGLSYGLYWWLKLETRSTVTKVVAPVQSQQAAVTPGGNKAILTLGDGSTVLLDNARSGLLGKQGDVTIIKSGSGQLRYDSLKKIDPAEIVYNTITTPNGGQYQIRLPDGTKVWLNAASSLRFPTGFVGKERRVDITGEVYFEVTKDARKPFIVRCPNQEVKVLGTHFNIMAYPNEKSVETTLLEGSVYVSNAHQSVLLLPGQQAKFTTNGSPIKVIDAVDADQEIAWKNGYFQFNDDQIEDIMRQVSRWYDVDIVYQGTTPQGHFTGRLPRNADVSKVLKIFTLSGIQYRIDGKKIIVMP